MKRIFLALLVMSLAGCATSARYTPYTDQASPAKSKYYFVTVYPASVKLPVSPAYRVIGRVEVQGYASDGVDPDMLTEKAKTIARKRGADAIINANTQMVPFGESYVVGGHYGYRHYRPARYVSYGDTIVKFSGELIIFM